MNKFIVLSMLILTMACGSETIEPSSGMFEVMPTVGQEVGNAYLEGNLYDMKGIEGEAIRYSYAVNSSYFESFTYVEHNMGQAMSIFTVLHGSINDDIFTPGATTTFNYLNGAKGTKINVTVRGCLFKEEGERLNLYFDDVASEVEVTTEILNNNVKRINYIARWLDVNNNIINELSGFNNISIE